MSDEHVTRLHFDCTPQQYHAGLDKLWSALLVSGPQDDDVYTMTVKEIEHLRAENERLRKLLREVLPCLFVDQCYSELRDKIKKEVGDE